VNLSKINNPDQVCSDNVGGSFRCFGRINVVRANPTKLFICILVTGPFDVVPELHPEAPVELRVSNLLDLEMFITIDDFHSSRRRFLATGEWVRKVRFELKDLENWVNLGKRFW
jgi:hypothetical protein